MKLVCLIFLHLMALFLFWPALILTFLLHISHDIQQKNTKNRAKEKKENEAQREKEYLENYKRQRLNEIHQEKMESWEPLEENPDENYTNSY